MQLKKLIINLLSWNASSKHKEIKSSNVFMQLWHRKENFNKNSKCQKMHQFIEYLVQSFTKYERSSTAPNSSRIHIDSRLHEVAWILQLLAQNTRDTWLLWNIAET